MAVVARMKRTVKPYKARVEYIENTGSSYIDTGISPVVYTMKFECVVSHAQDSRTIFGAISENEIAAVYNGMGMWFKAFNTSNAQSYSGAQSDIYTLGYSDGYSYVKINGAWQGQQAIGSTANITLPMTIFMRNGVSESNATGRCYSFWLKDENDVLLQSLIPVLDFSDVPCMYDEVTGAFFYNQGTGSFVAGPIVGGGDLMWGIARKVQFGWSARDYVRDGLVAMWDGIENVGYGQHDNTATTWVDLSGNGNNWTLGNLSYWDNNSLRKDGSVGWMCYGSFSAIDYITFECVIRPVKGTKQTGRFFFNTGRARGNVVMMTMLYPVVYGERDGNIARPAMNKVLENNIDTNISLIVGDDYLLSKTYSNATEYGLTSRVYGWPNTERPTLGGSSETDTDYPFSGKVYCIRMYSRALTASEIAHNYAVDKARFNLT